MDTPAMFPVDESNPRIVTVPCMSGTPWNSSQMRPLAHRDLETYRLPERLDSIEAYVGDLQERVENRGPFILVGDSFGAVIALGLAIRKPSQMRALVMSGGFASQPLSNPLMRFRATAAGLAPAAIYRDLTLRIHANALASHYDACAEIPWTEADSRRLFVDNTPFSSYAARLKATRHVDYRGQLDRVEVPTLILTPSHDTLIGAEAARALLEGIPDSREVILPHSGHMFRFTHPSAYALAIEQFLSEVLTRPVAPVRASQRRLL